MTVVSVENFEFWKIGSVEYISSFDTINNVGNTELQKFIQWTLSKCSTAFTDWLFYLHQTKTGLHNDEI